MLYRKVTRLWWTYDDANILRLVIENKLRLFFTDGALWPQKLFTPLEPIAYRWQLTAFGLDPSRWFVVHLALATCAALGFYVALRSYFATAAAFVGTALYVASVPFVSLATELSVTHYFQSMALAGVAFALYVRALRNERYALAIASAALYLAAMLAKETVVPLAILLVVLPERDLRARVRLSIPHCVALAVYLVWRRTVLGTLLGGYGWAVGEGEWGRLLATLPQKLAAGSTGAGAAIGFALLAMLVILAVIAIRSRHALLLVLVALALAIGPVVPVSKEMQRRYVVMPWLAIAVTAVAGVERLRMNPRTKQTGGVLLVLLPLIAIGVNRQEWGFEYARIKRMSDEGRVFWDMPPNGLLRLPTIPPAAIAELNWVKSYAKRPSGAGWFYDDIYLCANGFAGKDVWQYDASSRSVVNVTNSVATIASKSCGAIRPNAPLTADFRYRNGALFWRFGPYQDGKWRAVVANGVLAFDLPRSDGFRLDGPGMSLRVRYESPQGWVTYSPEIGLDFVHHPDVSWRR